MKRLLTSALLMITIAFAASGCGDGNSSSPGSVDAEADSSPFGFLDAPPDQFEYYSELGTHWLRGGREGVDWGEIENSPGVYTWDAKDAELCNFAENGISLVYSLRPINALYGTYWDERDLDSTDEYPDGYLANWRDFVRAFVERYDGDGRDDAPCASGIRISDYQLVHELAPMGMDYWQAHPDQYAEVFEVTYSAMKDACAECVLFMPVPPRSELQSDMNFLDDVLRRLAGRGLEDVGFDYHLWSHSEDASLQYSWMTRGEDYLDGVAYMDEIRGIVFRHGFRDTHIISAESGMGATGEMERDQAGYVVRAYVSNLAHGQERQLWTCTLEYSHNTEDSIFTHTGLVHNPLNADGLSHRKLAYHAYRKMVETLRGSDWGAIESVRESGGIYIYRFDRGGTDVYVIWWDYFNDTSGADSKAVSLAVQADAVIVTEAVPRGNSGAEVTDYEGAFAPQRVTVRDGEASFELGDSPVYVEAAY